MNHVPENLKPKDKSATTALALAVYRAGLRAVVKGDTNPALKRELAAMRARLERRGAK